jgi:hypothetical protein
MAKGNFWEDTVRDSAAGLPDLVSQTADMVRGGKAPPFSVKLDPAQKRDYWLSLTPQERQVRLQGMDERAAARLLREIGG